MPEAEEGTELVDGVPDDLRLQAASKRHGQVCGNVYVALRAALEKTGSPCEASPASPLVWINEARGYVPDVFVECPKERVDHLEQRPDLDPRRYVFPRIVVEVLSASTAGRDTTVKLDDYQSVSTIQHYLVIDPERNRLWHYYRKQHSKEFDVRLGSVTSTLELDSFSVLAADIFQ